MHKSGFLLMICINFVTGKLKKAFNKFQTEEDESPC